MAHCSRCGKPIVCDEHVHQVQGLKKPCPLEKGALWVRVLKEDGGVIDVPVTVELRRNGTKTGPKNTAEEGLAAFDPLESGEYSATMSEELPLSVKETHKPPENRTKYATVTSGEIASLKFKLVAKKPKIDVIEEYDFLELIAGTTKEHTITIKNVGDADLVIKSLKFDPLFPEGPGNTLKNNTTVKPGKTVDLEVRYAPVKWGDHAGVLEIESTDPDFDIKPVNLKGKATQKLTLVAVDKHFAPSVENLDIKYDIQGFSDSDVVELRIIEENTKKVLFSRELANGPEKANGTHDITWDGLGTDKKYIHPQIGPFQVVLYHTDPIQDQKPFKVLYHSLHLEPGDWLPKEEIDELESHVSGEKPDFNGADSIFCGNVKTIRWTWYQLALQGFYPGPHVTALATGDPLGKAIRRFRQSVPALYKPLHLMDPDRGYVSQSGPLADAEKIDGPLLKHLAAGTYTRLGSGAKAESLVLSDDTVLKETGSATKAKLYADVDRFYYEEELKANEMMKVHKEWVLRPTLCLKANVTLTAKNDTEVKAKHPSAIGPIQVKWSWTDRAQDTSGLPAHTTAKPSRVKEFLDKVVNPLASYEYKNARTTAGGLIDGNNRAADDNVVFAEHDLFDSGLDSNLRWSGTVKDQDKHLSMSGSTLVFFRPSIIGGDNYKIKASLVAGTFTRTAETGEIELWRRVTIGAYIKWGAATKPVSTEWDKVRTHFRHAFVEVVGPLKDMEVSSLPTVPKDLLKQQMTTAHSGTISYYDQAATKLKYSPDYWIPEDPRSVEFSDTPDSDYAKPGNIVNALLIDTLASWLLVQRTDAQSLALPPVKARTAICNLWKGSATPWIKAVGDHFHPLFLALETFDPIPAKRKVARMPLGQLGGCPTNRAAILDALFYDILESTLTTWRARGVTTVDRVKVLGAFLQQVVNLKVKGQAAPIHHSTVTEACLFYLWLLADDNYLGKITGTPTVPNYVIRAADIEVFCPTDTAASGVAALVGPTHFNFTIPATRKTKVILTFKDPNDVDTYDYGALKTLLQTTNGYGMTVLRGTHADPVPRFVIDDLTDTRLDIDGRERLWEAEKAYTTGRMADCLQIPLNSVAATIDDAVRHTVLLPDTVPGGTVVICNFVAHPHPVPLKVGIPSLDIADYANPQNIAKDGGIVLIAKETDMERGHLYAHELAHCLFLSHWQLQNENITNDFSHPEDHDIADNNCIMSYSKYDGSYAASHFAKDAFKPEFCGKCNLRLRGWDLAGLPDSARDLEPVFPLPAAQAAVANTCPDLVNMHTMMLAIMAELGVVKASAVNNPSYPAGNAWMRLYAATTKGSSGGITEYVRTAIALTQLPSNTQIPATTAPYVHKSDSALLDAELLIKPNDKSESSWETMLYYVYANGGVTNAPSITLNAASLRFFDPGTALHEAIHLYQNYDNLYITEGIVDFLGAMLANRFETTYNSGITYGYNPSYIQSTQFVVDELIPRLGLEKAAKAFFETGKEGLQSVFKPNAMAKDFDVAIKRGPDGGGNHSYEAVRQLLLPLANCPTPATVPLSLQTEYAAAVTLLHTQLDTLAGVVGAPLPSTLVGADLQRRGRERVASMSRLKFKFDTWKEQRDEAKRFRSDNAIAPDGGKHRLVHRSAPYIENKHKDMHWFNRMFMACGGSSLNP